MLLTLWLWRFHHLKWEKDLYDHRQKGYEKNVWEDIQISFILSENPHPVSCYLLEFKRHQEKIIVEFYENSVFSVFVITSLFCTDLNCYTLYYVFLLKVIKRKWCPLSLPSRSPRAFDKPNPSILALITFQQSLWQAPKSPSSDTT